MHTSKKIIQLIFEQNFYEVHFCEDRLIIKDNSRNLFFTYLERNGIYGLFQEESICCNSWRYRPKLEDICKSISALNALNSVLN